MSKIPKQRKKEVASEYKAQLQKNSKDTERSVRKNFPMRASVNFTPFHPETETDGNSFTKSSSIKGPIASSNKLETSGSSHGRAPRTLDSTTSANRLLHSLAYVPWQQPAPSQIHTVNRRRSISEARGPKYGAESSQMPQSLSSTESALRIDRVRLREGRCDASVAESSFGTYGTSEEYRLGHQTSNTNSFITDTKSSSVLQSHGRSSVMMSVATPSEPVDTNDRSRGRQSRAADRSYGPRLRSASQGLRNLGNTCYMNSILQCLAKIPWFENERAFPSKFQDDLLNEFFILMKKMRENDTDTPLDPVLFRKQISSLGFRFSSSEQNDAHEFLMCLLSRLSKTLKSERPRDLVEEFLLGRQQNVIRFKDCKHVLNNVQPFSTVSLPINLESGRSLLRYETVELMKCLECYTRKQDVDGDALCLECNQMQLCSIETSFKHLPRFLVIHLKRYDFQRAEKLENTISFPVKGLQIMHCGEVPGKEIYDLIAVCNHYGSLRFGHYTADIKSLSGSWYNYSDSRVTPNPTFATKSSLTSQEAYILFYQRSDIPR